MRKVAGYCIFIFGQLVFMACGLMVFIGAARDELSTSALFVYAIFISVAVVAMGVGWKMRGPNQG